MSSDQGSPDTTGMLVRVLQQLETRIPGMLKQLPDDVRGWWEARKAEDLSRCAEILVRARHKLTAEEQTAVDWVLAVAKRGK